MIVYSQRVVARDERALQASKTILGRPSSNYTCRAYMQHTSRLESRTAYEARAHVLGFGISSRHCLSGICKVDDWIEALWENDQEARPCSTGRSGACQVRAMDAEYSAVPYGTIIKKQCRKKCVRSSGSYVSYVIFLKSHKLHKL